jgi:hypothetical protein
MLFLGISQEIKANIPDQDLNLLDWGKSLIMV